MVGGRGRGALRFTAALLYGHTCSSGAVPVQPCHRMCYPACLIQGLRTAIDAVTASRSSGGKCCPCLACHAMHACTRVRESSCAVPGRRRWLACPSSWLPVILSSWLAAGRCAKSRRSGWRSRTLTSQAWWTYHSAAARLATWPPGSERHPLWRTRCAYMHACSGWLSPHPRRACR